MNNVTDKEVDDLMELMKKNGFPCWLVKGKEKEYNEKTKEDSK